MDELKLEIETSVITAKKRKLKATWAMANEPLKTCDESIDEFIKILNCWNKNKIRYRSIDDDWGGITDLFREN